VTRYQHRRRSAMPLKPSLLRLKFRATTPAWSSDFLTEGVPRIFDDQNGCQSLTPYEPPPLP